MSRYLEWVVDFCVQYSRYIEGGKVEYFRFPDYGKGSGRRFFAGNRLDIHWLSYNFALILLKLVHYAGLDGELCCCAAGVAEPHGEPASTNSAPAASAI